MPMNTLQVATIVYGMQLALHRVTLRQCHRAHTLQIDEDAAVCMHHVLTPQSPTLWCDTS
jgi:hypothetical protein